MTPPPDPNKKVPVSTRLEQWMVDRLDERAKRSPEANRSTVIRDMLREYFADRDKPSLRAAEDTPTYRTGNSLDRDR